MTDKLPPNLLALFAPRPPLRYLPPSDHASEERSTGIVQGVGDFLPALEEYKDKDGYVPSESWLQRRDRNKQEMKEKINTLLTDGIKDCMFSLLAFIGYSQIVHANQHLQTCRPMILKSVEMLSRLCLLAA